MAWPIDMEGEGVWTVAWRHTWTRNALKVPAWQDTEARDTHCWCCTVFTI